MDYMLNERQSSLLEFMIREYVHSARPVSSGRVAKSASLDVSSATIRNEMTELEQMGYIAQPHTSGGRVPTDKAYRWFVNQLLRTDMAEPSLTEKKKIKSALGGAGRDPRLVAKTVGDVLSDLSENLVITGISDTQDYYKFGLTSLLELPEFREFNRVFNVASFFQEFDRFFDEIEREFFGTKLNIFIGRENSIHQVRDEAVILAQYPLPEHLSGTLTLVGPTRMDYEHNLALVKYIIGELNHRHPWRRMI